jgi:hypothetical protein
LPCGVVYDMCVMCCAGGGAMHAPQRIQTNTTHKKHTHFPLRFLYRQNVGGEHRNTQRHKITCVLFYGCGAYVHESRFTLSAVRAGVEHTRLCICNARCKHTRTHRGTTIQTHTGSSHTFPFLHPPGQKREEFRDEEGSAALVMWCRPGTSGTVPRPILNSSEGEIWRGMAQHPPWQSAVALSTTGLDASKIQSRMCPTHLEVWSAPMPLAAKGSG